MSRTRPLQSHPEKVSHPGRWLQAVPEELHERPGGGAQELSFLPP